MPTLTPLKRFFRREDRALNDFLRREENYLKPAAPGRRSDRGPEADRLKYEILRAGL